MGKEHIRNHHLRGAKLFCGLLCHRNKKKVFICAHCAVCCVQDQIQMALTLLNIAQFF